MTTNKWIILPLLLGLFVLAGAATGCALGPNTPPPEGDLFNDGTSTEISLDTDPVSNDSDAQTEASGTSTQGESDTTADTLNPDTITVDSDTNSESNSDSDTEPTCDTEKEVVLYLSADDSNSMAGPAEARAAIEGGIRIAGRIRTYEFLNYYSFGYAPAEPGRVRVTAAMRANEDSTYNLQLGVRSADYSRDERRPVRLVLSLDNSGSMAGHAIEMIKASCLAIAGSLRAGDTVSVVTWNESQSVLLDAHAVSAANDTHLTSVCASLTSSGSTDLNAGLAKAYALAKASYDKHAINRVILMSDGDTNTGIASDQLIAENAADAEAEGIYLIGVGMASDLAKYKDALMDTVTDKGKGAYVFIDSEGEAKKMFGERFLSLVEIAARNLRVELKLPATFAMQQFHGEGYSGIPSEVDPQHLAANDEMVFHQVVSSCDPTAIAKDATITVTARYQHAITRTPQEDSFSATIVEVLEADTSALRKGDAIVAYAEALKAVQLGAGQPELKAALATIEAALSVLVGDPDLLEIKQLIQKAEQNGSKK